MNALKHLSNPTLLIKKVYNLLIYLINKTQFGNLGKGTIVYRQLLLTNKNKIFLGNNVIIMKNSRIELINRYAGENFNPRFTIGNFSQIHQNCHITCADNIEIGKNVVIVSNVTITDIIHPYEDIYLPINQSKIRTSPVYIGDQSYIYNNSVILPGVTIGKHCIIGANSVVKNDIPDYSVAVGCPAKVIKRYNFETNNWERV